MMMKRILSLVLVLLIIAALPVSAMAAEEDSIREALAMNLRATIAQRLLPKALGGGVVPANEIMINTPVVEKYIRDNEIERLPDAIKMGKEDGMISFNASLYALINNGDIAEDVGLEASAEPDALRMNLKGIFVGGL
jgi:Tfp pilus assembly pilus retraction ATPase PilT